MSDPAATEYEWTTIKPAMDSLEFGLHVPKGWQQAPIPQDQPDFNDPSAFMPLAVFVAPFGTVVFSVAARPAYAQGEPMHWLLTMAQQQNLQIEAPQPCELNELKGATCLAQQQSDVGPVQTRTVFLRNGNTMLLLSALAPLQIWPSLAATFDNMFGGFQMRWKLAGAEGGGGEETGDRGQGTGGGGVPANPYDHPSVQAAAQAAADAAAAQGGKPTSFADAALADDDASLNVEHKLNAFFRDNGLGLVPRVHQVDKKEKYVLLGCGAITAMLKVPLGWHVVDDGKRTLIFDSNNKIQVNLNQVQKGITPDQMIEAVLAKVREANPQVEHIRLDLLGMPTLLLRNVKADGENVDQAFLYRQGSGGALVQVRVTSVPADMPTAMNLTEVLVREVQFAG